MASADTIPFMPAELHGLPPFRLDAVGRRLVGPSPGRETSKTPNRFFEPQVKPRPSPVKVSAWGEMYASEVGFTKG